MDNTKFRCKSQKYEDRSQNGEISNEDQETMIFLKS